MRIFLTKRSLANHIADEVAKDRFKYMEATANNAAMYAVHYYVCWRTIETWRELLDQAEKRGDQYISLAQLIVDAGIKRGDVAEVEKK